jgi:hypothetical protein
MIRNLIYLDEPKLLSLSSQVLEGLSEFSLTEKTSSNESTESQRGPIASGRELADAMKSVETSVERRVLHDHAFALFEHKVSESGPLLDIPTHTAVSDTVAQIAKASFVRIRGRATFTDAAKLSALLKVFNALGKSIAYVTKGDDIRTAEKALNELRESTKDKTKFAAASKQLRQLADPEFLAQSMGMYQDPKMLEHLGVLLEFGLSDQLEIQQTVDGVLYTACLKRECLREAEDLIIRKYSRKTEKSVVVLGLVTQTANHSAEIPSVDRPAPVNMKEALSNMIDHIANMEVSMFGKSSLEVIIDPIAVYVSI